MRWDRQDAEAVDANALPGMQRLADVAGHHASPTFKDLVFHEVLTKSALNHVPESSREMPGAWTINPYRGCSHACRYCFARASHRYLDLDTGHDFDTQIIVKTNVAEVLARELRRLASSIPAVMLGTNTDPYQRAEGRYRLMPGIIGELVAAGVPFSILTKGTMLRRDLPLLAEAAQHVPVSVNLSIPIVAEELRREFEPGTPSAEARLRTVRAAVDAGLRVDVFLMPILPYLTDSRRSIMRTLDAVAASGATRALYSVLHLRPHVREWFMHWLGVYHPSLVSRYVDLYRGGDRAAQPYRRQLASVIKPLIRLYRLDAGHRPPTVPRRFVAGRQSLAESPVRGTALPLF